MPKHLKLFEGDLFVFPAGDGHCGVGQINELYGERNSGLIITVLRERYQNGVEPEDVDLEDILLSGRTLDALLFHGRWRVFGNRTAPTGIVPKPNSKVQIDGQVWVSDFYAKPLRVASRSEARQLDNHSIRAPIGFENAFLAFHGLSENNPNYEPLTMSYQERQAGIGKRPRILSWFN